MAITYGELLLMEAIGRPHFPENMPKWAQDLTVEVCTQFKVDIPVIKWASKGRRYSTGRAWSNEDQYSEERSFDLTIIAGTDEMDAKLVLLHELAHWTCPLGAHHGRQFWERAFDLYAAHGIPLMFAHDRERRYRAMAEEVGWRRVYLAYTKGGL